MPETLTQHSDTLALGRLGERLTAEYLESIGYQLVAANFSVPIGRNRLDAIVHAEIDLIAYDDPTLCFIEVKTRSSDWFAPPEANVDLRKQRQVTRAARAYRRLFGLQGATYRFDVVSVTVSAPDAEAPSTSPRIQLLKNYWTADKFRKQKWSDFHYDY
jgi:putative endonuclease